MKNGDKIWHRTFNLPGVLVGTPRASGSHAKAKIEGNSTACYYPRVDLLRFREDGKHESYPPPLPPEGYVPAPPPPPARPPAPVPVAPPDRLERAIAATAPKEAPRASGDVHQGDITLDYLLDQRRVIARDLAAFDERIAEVRVLAMLRRALAGVRIDGESGQRVGLSADALKIKHDTARALAAAERLAARGAL